MEGRHIGRQMSELISERDCGLVCRKRGRFLLSLRSLPLYTSGEKSSECNGSLRELDRC